MRWNKAARSRWTACAENGRSTSFALVEDPLPGIRRALVIAGSDKRGTIYGLFHLSERIGVSPLVHWNHVLAPPPGRGHADRG